MSDAKYVFQTPRLACRHWLPNDIEPLYEIYADPETVRWVDDGQPISHEECEQWMTVTANNYASRGYGMFALEDRSTGQVIGFCGLIHPGGQDEPEIKYAFHRSTWGQGLASEMIPALLNYGASAFGMPRIIATVNEDNLASIRVLQKAGARECDRVPEDDGSVTVVLEWWAPP